MPYPGNDNRGPLIEKPGPRRGFDVPPQTATEFVGIREYIGIVRRNLWLVFGILALIVGFTAYRVMQAPPQFRSVATVRLVNARGQMTAGMNSEQSFEQFGEFIETQIQVLLSESVARTAVQRSTLRLVPVGDEEFPREVSSAAFDDSVAAGPFELRFDDTRYSLVTGPTQTSAAYGEPVTGGGLTVTVERRPAVAAVSFNVVSESEAIGRVMGGFRAAARQSTNVLDLSYIGSSPHETRRVVNALADGFQAQNAASAQQQSRRRRIFLENQLRQTDSSLSLAAGAFSAYRSRRAVFSSTAKAGAQEAGLVNIDMRRAELDAEKTTYENLLSQAVRPTGATASGLRALISSPGIASNPVVQQLYTQLSELEVKRDNLLASGVASTNPDLISVRGMISITTDQIVDAIRSQVTSLQARIASLDRLRASGSSTIAAAPAGESEELQLNQEVQAIQRIKDQIQEELQKARMSEAVEAGEVEIVDLATRPGSQVPSGNPRKITLGLLIGLILGVGAAIVRDSLNDSIRRRSDIEKLLKVPGLAVIPRLSAGGASSGSLRRALTAKGGNGRAKSRLREADLVTLSNAASSGAEAFRTLRTNLMYSQAVRTMHSLLITSAAPAEGKSTTAANIAVSIAQQGMRVLLVDADLRRARLHRMFGVPREPGLTEVVLGAVDQEQATSATSVTGLYVLPSGKLPPNPSELVGGDQMRRTLESLVEAYDVVIIDTPPLLAASDAAILATLADGVILVLKAGSTDVAAAQQAMEQLNSVGARVIGAVLNDPDTKVPEYGHYYSYEYEYAAAPQD